MSISFTEERWLVIQIGASNSSCKKSTAEPSNWVFCRTDITGPESLDGQLSWTVVTRFTLFEYPRPTLMWYVLDRGTCRAERPLHNQEIHDAFDW